MGALLWMSRTIIASPGISATAGLRPGVKETAACADKLMYSRVGPKRGWDGKPSTVPAATVEFGLGHTPTFDRSSGFPARPYCMEC